MITPVVAILQVPKLPSSMTILNVVGLILILAGGLISMSYPQVYCKKL